MILKVSVIFLMICRSLVLSQKKAGDSCVEDYFHSMGVCIPSEHCESAKIALLNNGIRPTFCAQSFYDAPLVCCKDIGTYVPTTTSTTTTVPRTTTESSVSPVPLLTITENSAPLPWVDRNRDAPLIRPNTSVSEKKCEEYSRYGTPPPPDEPAPNELIVGGVKTDLNEFPHMAAIGWLNFEDTYSFNCGGSLVSPRFVLTAGHCTSDPTARVRAPALVRLGDQNIDPNEDDGANPEEIEIKAIHRHPSYKPPRKYDDIALLHLAKSAELSAAIRPACLWQRDALAHSSAIATGWGVGDAVGNPGFSRRGVVTGEHSKELQKVALPLQESAYCDRLLFVNRNRNWEGFAPTQLCAGELRPGKDTCQGDSGGPLQVKDGSVYRIVGITSFGLNNCAASGRPAVYTRVSSYVQWIEETVWPGD